MIPYPAFWLLCCNSFVYSFSAAWVEHGKIFLSTKEPPALKEESIFYLNQSNKIQPASLSLSPPNVHILSSSYGTVEPPYRKQLIFSSQHLPAFLIVHMGCENNPSTANQEVTAPAWENSDRKQQHNRIFQRWEVPYHLQEYGRYFRKASKKGRVNVLFGTVTTWCQGSVRGSVLRLGAGWDVLTIGRCLQWWEGCRGPWAGMPGLTLGHHCIEGQGFMWRGWTQPRWHESCKAGMASIITLITVIEKSCGNKKGSVF